MRFLLSIMFLHLLSADAHAHLGHLGELAGHSHWIALGAGTVAAAIAAALGKRKLDSEEEAKAESEEEAETEAAGA